MKEQVIREKVIKVVADSAKAVAPVEEKAELEAEGEIVEKPAKAPKKTTKKAEGEEKAEKAPPRSLRLRRPQDAVIRCIKGKRRGGGLSPPAAAGSYEHSRVGIIRHLSYRYIFMSLVPYVVEQTNRGERSYDIFSPLAQRPYRIPGRRGE